MKVEIKDIHGKTICEIEAKSENDFSGVDLSGKNLQFADLRGKNLKEANLEEADLYRANLEVAILRGANPRKAKLRKANLEGANLTKANLEGASLRWAIGNGKEIKTIKTVRWSIVIAGDQLAIGCQQHSFSQWMNFSDEEIEEMDDDALEWWKEWKPRIRAMIAD